MKKVYIFVIILICLSFKIISQPAFAWAKQFGGGTGTSDCSIAVDAFGNVYSCGTYAGSHDFDPGPGSFSLNSVSNSLDIFISKFDASGNFLWAKGIGSATMDEALSICLDASSNVYVTGNYSGSSTDFDPGPGVYTMTNTSVASYVLKLDLNGNFIWAKQTGTGSYGFAITIDFQNNICYTGQFTNVVDFDPGPGTYTLVSPSGANIFVSKLDQNGNFIFAKAFGGNNNDFPNAITTDASGNILTTGYYRGQVDFDPGPGTYTLGSNSSESVPFISKLDINGNFVWAKRFIGINTTGTDAGYGICTDAAGNVYSTGLGDNGMDLDPGPGVVSMTVTSTYQVYISKLNSAGNFIWGKVIGPQRLGGIALDGGNNVYVTGAFGSTVDIDPGPSTYTLASGGSFNPFVTKLDQNGNFVWGGGFIGDAVWGYAIAIGQSGDIYSSGLFGSMAGVSGADFDPGPGTFSITCTDPGSRYIQKMSSCFGAPPTPSAIGGNASVCPGSAYSYSISALVGATSYSWSLPGGWTGTSTTNIITTTASVNSGTISVAALNGCGTGSAQTLIVTISPSPTITVNSGSICSGQSYTMIPSGANSYTYQGGSAVVSPTANASYTVIGTSVAGCASANTATANITVNANPTVSMAGGAICPGGSFTLNPNGAATYTFVGGGPVVSPGVTTTYSVSGTSTTGCMSQIAIATVTVANNLTVTITGNNTVCSGSPINLTAGGAASYTWNTGSTSSTIAPTPTANTSYSVIGSSGSCSNTAVANITVGALPSLTLSSSNAANFCAGQTTTLTVTGATSYSWAGGPGTSTFAVSPTVTTIYTVSGTGVNGCSSTSAITQMVNNCTGLLGHVETNAGFQVFPNPFSERFTVKATTDAEVQVINCLGMLIVKAALQNGIAEIDLSNEAAGLYFVRCGTAIKSVVKGN